MRMLRFYLPVFVFLSITTLFSCRKKADPAVVPAGNGSLKVEFSNVVGTEALTLGDKWYVNQALDSFKLNTYKYYISNVSVKMADGTTYTEPESYHLINQEELLSRKFTLKNVPVGKYTSISFMIGIDSAHNVSGAQAGDLSPDKGMLWTWNTGYIMAKMEGTSPSSTAIDQAVTLHIAGFSGEFSVLKNVTLSFPEPADVSAANIPNVHIFSDVLEWFQNPTAISLKNDYFVMTTGKKAQNYANNYADMFHVDHVDN